MKLKKDEIAIYNVCLVLLFVCLFADKKSWEGGDTKS